MRPWLFSGYDRLHLGDVAGARALFLEIQAAGDARALLGLARCAERNGDPGQALSLSVAAAEASVPRATASAAAAALDPGNASAGVAVFPHLVRAAQDGSSFAANHAALACARGLHGQPTDAALAETWLRTAVEIDGDPAAWLNYGDLREDGLLPGGPVGAAHCYTEAVSSLRQRIESAAEPHLAPWHQHLLVSAFAKLHVGRGVMDAAARSGDALAHFVQYRCHAEALWEAPDPDLARRHLEAAVSAGQPDACAHAADQVLESGGDPARAAELLRLAAEADIPGAAFALAGLCLRGFGLAADADRAIALYQRAAARGHVRAMTMAAELLDQRGGEGDRALATLCLRKAARREHVPAMLAAARRARDGVGGDADPVAAVGGFVACQRRGCGDGMREAWALEPGLTEGEIARSDWLADADDRWLAEVAAHRAR